MSKFELKKFFKKIWVILVTIYFMLFDSTNNILFTFIEKKLITYLIVYYVRKQLKRVKIF